MPSGSKKQMAFFGTQDVPSREGTGAPLGSQNLASLRVTLWRSRATPHALRPSCSGSLPPRAATRALPRILGLRSSDSGQTKVSGPTADVEEGSGCGEETIRSSGGRLFWAVGEDGACRSSA